MTRSVKSSESLQAENRYEMSHRTRDAEPVPDFDKYPPTLNGLKWEAVRRGNQNRDAVMASCLARSRFFARGDMFVSRAGDGVSR